MLEKMLTPLARCLTITTLVTAVLASLSLPALAWVYKSEWLYTSKYDAFMLCPPSVATCAIFNLMICCGIIIIGSSFELMVWYYIG